MRQLQEPTARAPGHAHSPPERDKPRSSLLLEAALPDATRTSRHALAVSPADWPCLGDGAADLVRPCTRAAQVDRTPIGGVIR